MTSVQQIEQIVRIARELHRDIATGEEARKIYQIGEYWSSADETLSRLAFRRIANQDSAVFRFSEPLLPKLVSQAGSKA